MYTFGTSITKGQQKKIIKNGYFYKIDTFGYESIAEVVCSEFSSFIDDFNAVDYELTYVTHEKEKVPACRSKNFLCDDEDVISLNSVLSDNFWSDYEYQDYLKEPEEKIQEVLEEVKRVCNIQMFNYLSKIIYFDSIVLNEDRHFGNISLIRKGNEFKECPVFDNGLSLLSDVRKYPFKEEYSRLTPRVKSLPFESSFLAQVNAINNMGGKRLQINIDQLQNRIDEILRNPERYTDFKVLGLSRALNVLSESLRKTEGISWERKIITK